jgi:hypothetical protein
VVLDPVVTDLQSGGSRGRAGGAAVRRQVTIIGVPSSDSLENMAAFVDRHELEDLRHAVDLDRVSGTRSGCPASRPGVS